MPAPRRLTVSPLAVLAVLAALAGCTPPRIPGTDILDTKDTHAVLDVIQAYGKAMQARDAQAVLALVGHDFYDDAGTPDPADDLDYAKLEQTLPQDLAKIEAIRVELTVRSVVVEKDVATAEVLYDAWYRIQTPAGTVPKRVSDVHRMAFKREAGTWKITSGL